MSVAIPSLRGAIAVPGWAKNELWRKARAVPSLDLRFADSKSLVDAITGGQLVTFTRASSGTFVGSDGVIRTAVTNLLLRSEEFDNASWTKTAATVTANTITGPFGGLTADTLTEDNTNASHIVFQGVSVVANLPYVFSCYAKAGQRNWVQLAAQMTGHGANVWANFDLAAGTVGAIGTSVTASIAPIGDGWYRCAVFGIASATSATGGFAIALLNGNTNSRLPSYLGDNASGAYIWGAQQEQSSTVGEYIPTTSTINSAPRFDHNPTTGESLGLLVEEQRANLVLRSEEFDDAYWVKTRASVTANAASAPTGNVTADKLVEDDTASATHRIDSGTISAPSGATTFSLYAKAAERDRLTISFDGSPGGLASSASCVFNLSTGVASSPSVLGNISNARASIVNAGDGWYRIILTASASAAFTMTCRINLMDATGASYTGDNTSGLFLWGAQVE